MPIDPTILKLAELVAKLPNWEAREVSRALISANEEIERLRKWIAGTPHSYGCATVITQCCKRCQSDPCSARCQADDYGGRGPCNCRKAEVSDVA